MEISILHCHRFSGKVITTKFLARVRDEPAETPLAPATKFRTRHDSRAGVECVKFVATCWQGMGFLQKEIPSNLNLL